MAPTTVRRTARQRVREELTAEITEHGRAQLATLGGAGISLRAIAREMGMSSSALFRYVPSRDALLTTLIIDSYGSMADAAETAEAAVHEQSPTERWAAICHAVRDWALVHPHEYALIFGSPIPGYAAPPDTIGPASRVPVLLSALLLDAPADGAGTPQGGLAPEVLAAVTPVLATMPDGVAPDLAVRGLMAWTYLFGAVSFELFGHRHGVVADPAAFFDHEVRRIARLLGLAT
ncbi:MAG TPA: TetR/AcrR family transcriptional regulator [Actinotalea sp.]|nr:TetR/AcrR family transcriptional regulator [Actinotalea sp.]